jgi:hypothetical protein
MSPKRRRSAFDGAERYDNPVLDVVTLESAGVIFIEENGEGPGVRLRKRPD